MCGCHGRNDPWFIGCDLIDVAIPTAGYFFGLEFA